MKNIVLKGREIPLIFTTLEMKEAHEKIAPIGDLLKMLQGINPEDDKDRKYFMGPTHIDTVCRLICILGNAGLEEIGEKPDLEPRAVMRSIRPHDLGGYANACLDALAEGMMSEIPPREPDGPVDVTLEEMNKKKGKAD